MGTPLFRHLKTSKFSKVTKPDGFFVESISTIKIRIFKRKNRAQNIEKGQNGRHFCDFEKKNFAIFGILLFFCFDFNLLDIHFNAEFVDFENFEIHSVTKNHLTKPKETFSNL